ncbi:hypothetical protein AK812_SmicGene1694 [Symbiodinium microadriaticum]|uniref:Uncharacterized protein n=1 Tax=Symbiodinium microadriaticum TaxID=2951 RepID=A0A1Q9F3H9_SYMMI|nr:hypothetical protein AK812_SmicGene1694 [Symbiodinium microadriaticum]
MRRGPRNTLIGGGSGALKGHLANLVRPDPEVLRRAIRGECHFNSIKVRMVSYKPLAPQYDHRLAQDIHTSKDSGFQLQLEAWEALIQGLEAAVKNPQGIANWDEFSGALQEERTRGKGKEEPLGNGKRGVGQRVLEVFEVERFHLVSKSEVQKDVRADTLELDRGLYRATTAWHVDKHPGTDDDGWMYGNGLAWSWNISTWEAVTYSLHCSGDDKNSEKAKAGTFDFFRRRRWTRTYA